MASFFLQMSGVPGAGKTTVARAIAQQTGAVIIDHDITKSALLDADVPVELAGPASYHLLGALARHFLEQGHSVIHDSPCRYQNLLDRGQALAAEFAVAYRYIECVLADLDELDRRLRTRPRHRSQLAGVYTAPTAGSGKTVFGEAVFRDWMASMKRPLSTPFLQLDTSPPLEQYIAQALAYVQTSAC